MKKAEWTASFPEDHPWYVYFRRILTIYWEEQEAMAEQAAVLKVEATAMASTVDPATEGDCPYRDGQRVRARKEILLFGAGTVGGDPHREGAGVWLSVRLDDPEKGKFYSKENPVRVLAKWFEPEAPEPTSPKPRKPRVKKSVPPDE